MARRGGSGAMVVTIYWRDIPAQVNGQSGRDRHQVVLSGKFQRAIDRAKRKAHIYTAEDDIAQWHRISEPCDGDAAAAAEAAAQHLEESLTREYLGKLAYAGGYVADIDGAAVDRAELLALEELDGTVAGAGDAATPTTTDDPHTPEPIGSPGSDPRGET